MENKKKIYLYLLSFSTFLYIGGFILDENSAGGGSYIGDLKLIWDNLQIFINYSLIESIAHENYVAGRTPIALIIHKYLNPFVNEIENFRLSVFIISCILPITLIFTPYIINKKADLDYNNIFFASLIMISPYFRTTSYWALEENYGLIFLIITYIFFKKNIKIETKKEIDIKNIFLICLTSSLTFYFDQKLIFIPLICYLSIIFHSSRNSIIFSTIFFFLFSLPYLFLIKAWGGLLPKTAVDRMLTFEIINIGYTLSIIAFYIFPFLITSGLGKKEFRSLISEKNNILILSISIIFLIYVYLSYDYSIKWVSGNGIFYKITTSLFVENLFQKIFLIIIFFFSTIILLLYFKSLNDRLIILFFLLLSLIVTPVYQEYFDPLILILIYSFFNRKENLNIKKSILIYSYFLILLTGANIYYFKVLSKFY